MRKDRRPTAQQRSSAVDTAFGRLTLICTLGLVAGTLLWASLARADDALQTIFTKLDSNSDGAIDRTEYDLNKIMVIVAFDRNQNSHLEPGEVNISAENFAAIDQDGDGKISGFEFVESRLGKFETIDADGDGLVTMEELRAYVLKLRS